MSEPTPRRYSDEEVGRLLKHATDIQKVSVGHGTASVVGRTLTWKSDTGQNQRSLQVTVASRDGETLIHTEERLHGLAGGLYGGMMGGAGIGIGVGVGVGVGVEVLGSALFATLLPVGFLGAMYLAAREIMRRTGLGRRRRLQHLVDRIAEYVRPDPSTRREPRGDALAGSDARALPARE